MKFGRGGSLPRFEDPRLLAGGGRYLDDLAFDGLAHAVIVRSPSGRRARRFGGLHR